MLGVRWTIGDVNGRGFHALRLSVWGAWRLFGPEARYRIYVNTIAIADAQALTGELPDDVEWIPVSRQLPSWLDDSVGHGMAEGVAWKLVPMRAFEGCYELSLDNDVVLWSLPTALDAWLDGATPCLLAADVRACFGRFAGACGDQPLNAGIRGLAPTVDLGAALRSVLGAHAGAVGSEVDEQGLQVAAIRAAGAVGVVGLDDVTICSPFPPHLPHLGRAGAHFVGLNTRSLGFEFQGRRAEDVRAEHWDRLLPEIARRVCVSA